MIAIFVKDGAIREWSRERQDWLTFPADGVLDDPTLVRPVAVRALLDAVVADNAVVDALERKANPRLAELAARQHEKGLEVGLEKGLGVAIEVACELLGISIGPRERAQLEPLDATALEALLARLKSERAWPTD